MKQLTLALLLSIAPLALNAHNCGNCDRTEEIIEQVVEQAQDDRCCNTVTESALPDATVTQEATSAFVTITGTHEVSAANWDFVVNFATTTFGSTPATQTENSVTFVFERNDLTTAAWLELLTEVESKLVTVQSTITNNEDFGGTIVFGLNK